MSQEQISGSLSQNLLTLLAFDSESLPILASTLEPGMFESDFYKHICQLSLEFYREFKTAPGDHLPDLLEPKLNQETRESEAYLKILINLFNNKDEVNRDYVLSQLNRFIRQQALKDGIITAHQYVKDGDLENAEEALNRAVSKQIKVFEPGIMVADTSKSLAFLNATTPAYPIGIKQLDDMDLGPARGELLVILAPANRGKTQFCAHIAKVCALNRLKVLVISLEMSEQKYTQRILQSLFAISKRQSEVVYTSFNEDEDGKLMGFRLEMVERPTLKDENIGRIITEKLSKFHNKIKILVKRFPTNALTMKGLEAYLDSLERFSNYVPDILIIDYADLMLIDAANIRVATSNVYKDLRRIAVERNIGVVSPSQANRLAEDARIITLKHLAEDYSKAATADNVIAYCQTSLEYQLGLARLFIAKARDEERDLTILISQAYKMSQFCIRSHLISDRYWSLLDAHNNQNDEDNGTQPPAHTPRRSLRRRSG